MLLCVSGALYKRTVGHVVSVLIVVESPAVVICVLERVEGILITSSLFLVSLIHSG